MSTTEASSIPPLVNVSFDEFLKLDLRVAKILEAKAHPKADRLILLQVDFGDLGHRQVVAGIREFFQPDQLVGKSVLMVANLEPRVIRGETSHGMILAAKDQGTLALFEPISADPTLSVGPGIKVG